MKHFLYIAIFSLVMAMLLSSCYQAGNPGCFTGAFIADKPTNEDINNFKGLYGKRPYMIMVFVGWGDFIDAKVIDDVYAQGSILMATWEPWDPATRKAIDYDMILSGGNDSYIDNFASRIKSIPGTAFIRFAHEVNGDWYPWSGSKIGKEKYISMYRYVKSRFDALGIKNVKWVYSVNWEDVPSENNSYLSYYPGDSYVDFVGLDGYNWGNTKQWSRWKSFKEIFSSRASEIKRVLKKPVIITEFSSSSSGGDKALWIKEALSYIMENKNITAFVLFNVDKETDWNFPKGTECGNRLRDGLNDRYFIEKLSS